MLKTVLHDWEDESAIAILRACRQAMKPTARLLVIERIIGPPNTDLDAKLLDLNMLVMNVVWSARESNSRRPLTQVASASPTRRQPRARLACLRENPLKRRGWTWQAH